METREILKRVQDGELSIEEAEKFFRKQPFEEMGYAKLDTHRKIRSGFAEVIFCSGKADDHLLRIFGRLYEQDQEVFGTRATQEQYEMIRKVYPQTVYDPVSRIIKIEKEGKIRQGKAAVCTAGTADIPVAEEAAQTAEYFGTAVERIYDVGVSGIHRLLANIDSIQEANCVVAVAGMEGALASVMGGLVDKPVIAVPTSIGYGASMHGLSALLTMINSCANGIAVVNIDNGYGAGYLAAQINRLAVPSVSCAIEKHCSFFQNTECEYFPCHKGIDPRDFNCLFCYCPLYMLGTECGGNPQYTENGIKDCSNCTFPHQREHYRSVTGQFSRIAEIAGSGKN